MDLRFVAECAVRLLASTASAFVLGLERKKWQHTVGLRTLILISISCTLLCMVQSSLVKGGTGSETSRVAAAVVTGIGFLGGGAIMRQGLNIRGLTSAAVIWLAAAEGLACGVGLFIPALMVLLIAMATLVTSEHTEGHYSSEKTKTVRITYTAQMDEVRKANEETKKVLKAMGYIVRDVNIETDGQTSGSLPPRGYGASSISVNDARHPLKIEMEYSVKSPPKDDPMALVEAIEAIEATRGSVAHIALSDGV